MKLQFQGPFTLDGESTSVFSAAAAAGPGVYIWAVAVDGEFVASYVGETGESIARRNKEHVIRTLGGDYRICDPVDMRRGRGDRIVWNGLWRRGCRDKTSEFLARYVELAPMIRSYIEVHRVFAAPLDTDTRSRRRVEAALAAAVLNAGGSASALLPTDIRYTGRRLGEASLACTLALPCPIAGLRETVDA